MIWDGMMYLPLCICGQMVEEEVEEVVENEDEIQQEKQRGGLFIESLFEVFEDCSCLHNKDNTTQLLIANNNNNNNMVIQ